MFKIGRLCIKIAGRDAGMKCVIIDTIDKNHVLIDGQTRRRKCNIKHLEPLNQVLKVTKNAPRTQIIREFKTLNIDIKESKPKKRITRPKKSRKKKAEPVKQPVRPVKKEEKVKKELKETPTKSLPEKPRKETVPAKKKEK